MLWAIFDQSSDRQTGEACIRKFLGLADWVLDIYDIFSRVGKRIFIKRRALMIIINTTGPLTGLL